MTVIAYRYRAYPNAGQRELFARHFGCKRKVFNLYLEEAHRLFQKTGSILSAYAFIKKLPSMKRTPELNLNFAHCLRSVFFKGQYPLSYAMVGVIPKNGRKDPLPRAQHPVWADSNSAMAI